MRHVFIVNPAAGKNSRATNFIPEIESYFASHDGEFSIRLTEGPNHASEIAKEEASKGDPVRLYAIGGDGTLFEVTNGAEGFDNVEIASVPCGSGNDYVKLYGGAEPFLNIPNLIEGNAKKVDSIRCGDKLSLNICSMGLDADVAARMAHYKRWPLVSGALAYDLAVIYTLCRPMGNQLKITMETPEATITREGRYLFALAANGQYYGGGYHGAPGAQADDGILDFVLVKTVPRLKAISLIGGYKRGEHYDWDMCEHLQGTKMEVTCTKDACVNIDGECIEKNNVTFEILPNHFSFVIPKSL